MRCGPGPTISDKGPKIGILVSKHESVERGQGIPADVKPQYDSSRRRFTAPLSPGLTIGPRLCLVQPSRRAEPLPEFGSLAPRSQIDPMRQRPRNDAVWISCGVQRELTAAMV